MTDEEIQELLRKAGIGEDQLKYYTASSGELPGLFGFNQAQSSKFGELFGGLGQFDPSKAYEAYGAIDEYGQKKTSDIASTLETGRYGLSQGLMSNIGGIRENIGTNIPGFGARDREIGEQRAGAQGGALDLSRQSDMSLLNLEEMLGGRKAAVAGTTQSWGQRLMNLVAQIYQMDPGGGGGTQSSGGYRAGGGIPGRNVQDQYGIVPE